jgi:photosystem II stability/assembly factor-like uncharacterized protein
MVRWRFSGNRVQHTRDGGARWTPAVPAEAPETLTAGSAPTPTICWFVGRSGLVLLASEDSPLVRLNFPQRVDFSSIDAEDARRASATTVDGRVFTTADGGQSWRQR